MRIAMATDHLILLRPPCPDSDDPEFIGLLEVIADAAGARWVELELAVEGSDDRCTFSVGNEGSAAGAEVPLDVAGLGSATLRIDSTGVISPVLSRLAAFTLERMLRSHRLHAQAMVLRGALDTSTSAVLVFDRQGDIVYANPPADRLLSRQTEDGLAVERPGKSPKPLFTLLCSLVEEIAARPPADAAWQGTFALSDGSVLVCDIMPLRVHDSRSNPGVMIILQTVDALPNRYLDAFTASYKLSPREEDVMRLLQEGLTAACIADRLGISLHTVRDHLKHLYRKTATGSRSELLNLLASATHAPPVEGNRRRRQG